MRPLFRLLHFFFLLQSLLLHHSFLLALQQRQVHHRRVPSLRSSRNQLFQRRVRLLRTNGRHSLFTQSRVCCLCTQTVLVQKGHTFRSISTAKSCKKTNGLPFCFTLLIYVWLHSFQSLLKTMNNMRCTHATQNGT